MTLSRQAELVAATFRPIEQPSVDRQLRARTSRAANDECDTLVFWLDGGEGLSTAFNGLRVRLATSATMFRVLLRGFRSGVVAVSSPPAGELDLEAVARARRGRPAMRALLVNGSDAMDQRLRALELGFDDAIPNLIDPREIGRRVARLREIARRNTSPMLPIGTGIELDLTAHALRRDGKLIHLRPMEFRLLAELARHPGRPVSRSWLLQHVWRTHALLDTRTVDVHIRWLREKVEPEPWCPVHLLTVRGVGYQLEPGLLPAVNTPAKAR